MNGQEKYEVQAVRNKSEAVDNLKTGQRYDPTFIA
jgi:hypothetical protein